MKKIITLALVFLSLVVFSFLAGEKKKPFSFQLVHPLVFFDKELFDRGVAQVKSQNQPLDFPIAAGIIPHDFFASFMIADFFQKLSFQKPKTIILIGPNHSEAGNFKALTSLYRWQTPFGAVEPNGVIVKGLFGRNLVKISEGVLENEQSIGAIMPFMKFYLPESSIVPIILSRRMTIEEINILAEKLGSYAKNGIPVIASADFSHYLKSREAQKNDILTLKLMKNFDYPAILSLDSDYLDSPPTLVTALMVARKLDKNNLKILHHTNSGELQKKYFTPVTSYFSIVFH